MFRIILTATNEQEFIKLEQWLFELDAPREKIKASIKCTYNDTYYSYISKFEPLSQKIKFITNN